MIMIIKEILKLTRVHTLESNNNHLEIEVEVKEVNLKNNTIKNNK